MVKNNQMNNRPSKQFAHDKMHSVDKKKSNHQAMLKAAKARKKRKKK